MDPFSSSFYVSQLKLWVGGDELFVALPLHGPFGWHHRTQMTSWEARGFQHQHLALWQHQHLALWQPVRPSVPSLGCLQMFLILQFVSLFPPPQKMFTQRHLRPKELAGSYQMGSFVFPSGAAAFYIYALIQEVYLRASPKPHLWKIEVTWKMLRAGDSKQIILLFTPSSPLNMLFLNVDQY